MVKCPTMKVSWLLVVALSSLSTSDVVHGQPACADFAPPARFKGTKIFNSFSGEYLPLKGVNYYPRPNAGPLVQSNSIDFYTEEYRAAWERDIQEFRQLRVNAIRLHAVDPSLNHDAFMCALKAAGIYVIVGLSADCENCAITKDNPPTCYPPELKTRGEFVIQQFAKYENVLAFDAGNEVALNALQHLGNVPCQKQFIRDMRNYIRGCAAGGTMRHIPVGVVLADINRQEKSQYYNCQSSDSMDKAEFVGINTYLHCDGSATSIDGLVGYKTLLDDYKSYGMTVPVLVTEYGCLNDSFEPMAGFDAQRNFLQTDALFSPEYREIFNGAFVFEYSTEKIYSQSPFPFIQFGAGNAGLGFFQPESCNYQDLPCDYVRFPQFGVLAAKHLKVDTSDEPSFDDYVPPVRDPPACPNRFPSLNSFVWPSYSVEDLTCPVRVPVYCLGVPGECVLETLPPFSMPPTVDSLASSPTSDTQEGATSTTPPAQRPTTTPSTQTAPISTKPDTALPSTMPANVPTMVPSMVPTEYTYKPADFLVLPKSQSSAAAPRFSKTGSSYVIFCMSVAATLLLIIII